MDPGLKALLEVLIRGVISKQLDRLEKKTEVEEVKVASSVTTESPKAQNEEEK